jgi:hypothetical protein
MALLRKGKRLDPNECFDDDGRIKWPLGQTEREEWARLIYGNQLAASVDYWINYAKDLLEQPAPRRPYAFLNNAASADRAYRGTFSTLTAKQKRRVLMLVAEVASGVLYSSQKALDDVFEFEGQLEIKLRTKVGSGENAEITLAPGEEELYHLALQSLDTFSEFAEACSPDLTAPVKFELSPQDEARRPDVKAVAESFNKMGAACLVVYDGDDASPNAKSYWLAFQDYESVLDLVVEDGIVIHATFTFFSSEQDPFYTGDDPSLIETVRTIFESFGWEMRGGKETVA